MKYLAKVVLNINQNYAYIQNADTNAYLEGKFIEINTSLAQKSQSGHTHDDRYYTETEIDNKLNAKAPAYTYGTEDLTVGTSALETGKLYFVYE